MPSIELFRDRQKLFSRLVDEKNWESLTIEFPRSVIAWEMRIDAISDLASLISVLKLATRCCRKSPTLWDRLLRVAPDDVEVHAEAMEAIGLNGSAESIIVKVEKFFDSHENGSEAVEKRRNRSQRIIDIKCQFEPLVFPKDFSSFCLPTDSAPAYIEALSEWIDEQEDVLQRLVFVYNDDLASWRMYCDWLHLQGRNEDLMDVLESACTSYVSYNPNMWALGAEYAKLIQNDAAIEWSRNALSRNVEYLECGSLEVIASILPEEEWSSIFPNDSIMGMFVCFLKFVRNDDEKCLKMILETLKHRENVDLSDADVGLLCFALRVLGFEHGLRIDRILKHNAQKILRSLQDGDPLRDYVTKLIQGSTTAPLPVAKAPPKPVVHSHNHNLPRRPLPGYTPGWMAEEYAKKHKI